MKIKWILIKLAALHPFALKNSPQGSKACVTAYRRQIHILLKLVHYMSYIKPCLHNCPCFRDIQYMYPLHCHHLYSPSL